MDPVPLERHHAEQPGRATPLLGDSFSALLAVSDRAGPVFFRKIGYRGAGHSARDSDKARANLAVPIRAGSAIPTSETSVL
jgi:hypothetical protein